MGREVEALEIYVDQGVVLTIGVFDGVHRGHQHLIGQTIARARELDCLSAIMTFDRHPETVLRPRMGPIYLMTVQEKMDTLRHLGADLRVLLRFDKELAATPARDFVAMLRHRLNIREMWIGPDFALGRKREGNLAFLQALGREQGFGVHAVDPLLVDGEVDSSTLIRGKLRAGDIASATRLLGRFPRLSGQVVEGARRGRQIGFPTANLAVDSSIVLPADGVYATCAYLDGKTLPAVTNVGTRPSFDNGRRTIETHLLDFSGDIYGRTLLVEFRQRLRDESKFGSVQDLICQIKRDVEQTRDLLHAPRCT